MKTIFLESLKRTSYVQFQKNWIADSFNHLKEIPGISGVAVRLIQPDSAQKKEFILSHPYSQSEIETMLDWGESFSSDLEDKSNPGEISNCNFPDGRPGLVAFSQFANRQASFGEIFFFYHPLPQKDYRELSFFCDQTARLLTDKLLDSFISGQITKFIEPGMILDFLTTLHLDMGLDSPVGSTQASATQNQWFDEDSAYLHRFLTTVKNEFNFETVFVVQKVFPDSIHVVIESNTDDLEKIRPDTLEMIKDFLHHDSWGSLEKARISISGGSQPSKKAGDISQTFSQSFVCDVGDTRFGLLGVNVFKGTNFSQISKVMALLSNHLALRFAHLFQFRKEKNDRDMLQKINLICNVITSKVEEVDGILSLFIEQLKENFGQNSGAIILTPPGTKELNNIKTFGNLPEDFNLESMLKSPGKIREIILSGAAIAGVEYHPIRYLIPFSSTRAFQTEDAEGEYKASSGYLMLFSVPENKVLSVDLRRFLETLLNGVGASLLVAFNYREKLETIRALEGLINKVSSKDELLSEMISIVRKILKVNRCSYLTLDDEGKFLTIEKFHGLSDEIVKNTRIPLGEEISGRVAKEGKSLRLNNIEEDERFKKRSQENYFNKSLLSVPLALNTGGERKIMGVINVNNKIDGRTFTEQDQKLLEAIAELVVVTLENNRLMKAKHEQDLADAELRAACKIQTGLLPKHFEGLPSSLEIFGRSVPARRVGGDFYEGLPLSDGRWLSAIGDVSGKGIPAAILMATTRTILRSVTRDTSDPSEILLRVNDILSKDLEVISREDDDFHFVTLMIVVTDPGTGLSVMSSAGHGPLIAVLNNKIVSIDTESGKPLGFPYLNMPFEQVTLQLKTNDILFLCTDGLHEERSPDGEMLGMTRVLSILENTQLQSAEIIVKEMFAAADRWRDSRDAHDDLTIFAIKYKGCH